MFPPTSVPNGGFFVLITPLMLAVLVDERRRTVASDRAQAGRASLRRELGTLALRFGLALARLGARLADEAMSS